MGKGGGLHEWLGGATHHYCREIIMKRKKVNNISTNLGGGREGGRRS